MTEVVQRWVERHEMAKQTAQGFSPGLMPKRGALKAPPTSRGEVQFGEGNPRTASGVAPERASQIKSTRQLLATPFGRQGAFLGAHDPELEPRAILLRHFMAI